MNFGKKLKYLRKQLQLTQLEMANMLLMDQSSYSRYETGKITPSIKIMERVAGKCNVSVNWLMEGGETGNDKDVNSNEQIMEILMENKKKLDDILKQFGGGKYLNYLLNKPFRQVLM